MSDESASRPGKKILVVDDDKVILSTLARNLKETGYQVVTALDGAQAVAAARKENPDLILLDIAFPPAVDGVVWDGFRIMDWFHRLDSANKIPIIVITGSVEVKDQERATRGGAVGYFRKPFDLDDMLTVIRSVLGS